MFAIVFACNVSTNKARRYEIDSNTEQKEEEKKRKSSSFFYIVFRTDKKNEKKKIFFCVHLYHIKLFERLYKHMNE